jgi:protein subunit release factor A
MIRTIEIHAAEGGTDSKLLVADLARAYERFFARKG